jgi:small subunit ribosomal protein S15
MTLTSKAKKKVIEKHQIHGKDTGSPEVQVAVLTEQIKKLVSHLKKNPKDNLSRRGLLKMVSKRRTLLNYLKKTSEKRYKNAIQKIGLKAKKSSFAKASKNKK